jgi:hypothetical protein
LRPERKKKKNFFVQLLQACVVAASCQKRFLAVGQFLNLGLQAQQKYHKTMPFLGQALKAGAQKYLGKAIRAGAYLSKAAPQISKGLTQVQRLASSSALQQAGKSIGIGPSVFNKVNQIAGAGSAIAAGLPSVAGDVRAGLMAASSNLTPARRSIADLYQKANSG